MNKRVFGIWGVERWGGGVAVVVVKGICRKWISGN